MVTGRFAPSSVRPSASASASASAVLRCRTKTGVDAAGVSAQRSMNRTARSPDGSGKHQLKEHLQRHLPNELWNFRS